MKTTITLLFTLFSIGYLQAQNLVISPKKALSKHYSIKQNGGDYIYLKNNSDGKLDLKFDMLSNTMDPLGWKTTLCTNVQCYDFFPQSESLGTIEKQKDAYFKVNVEFNGKTGTGKVVFKISETKNPKNTDTISFTYIVGLTGISLLSKTEVKLSPNPTSSFVHIAFTNYEALNNYQIRVISSLGKSISVKYSIIEKTIQVDMTNFAKGVYFIEIKGKDVSVVSNKFIKI